MTDNRQRGDRAGGAVPPLLLVIGGLLIALVAIVALIFQLRGGGSGAAGTASTPTGLSSPSVSAPADSAEETETSPATKSSTKGEKSMGADYVIPSADPTSITIATGQVDGNLAPQGLAADGTINPGRGEIIWFTGNDRVSPGQIGTSVVAAHVVWEGEPDVFAQIPNVQVGDRVEVGYADGESRSFTVTQAIPVDKDTLARSLTVWGEHPDHARLAIITCDQTQGFLPDGHTASNYVLIADAS